MQEAAYKNQETEMSAGGWGLDESERGRQQVSLQL